MPRVLICEDYAPHYDTYLDRLEEAGIVDLTVVWAKNAVEAKELLKREHFDLVLLDDRLPVAGDGLGLLEDIRQEADQNQKVDVIMTSIRGDEKATKRARNNGVIAYLPKPISRKDFQQWIIDYLNSKEPLDCDQ